jgi:hypothetical protein
MPVFSLKKQKKKGTKIKDFNLQIYKKKDVWSIQKKRHIWTHEKHLSDITFIAQFNN